MDDVTQANDDECTPEESARMDGLVAAIEALIEPIAEPWEVATALSVVIHRRPDIQQKILDLKLSMLLDRIEDAGRGPCQCPKCVAARTPKAKA